MSVSLVEIQTQWSINDLYDALEYISWQHHCMRDEQKRMEREAKNR